MYPSRTLDYRALSALPFCFPTSLGRPVTSPPDSALSALLFRRDRLPFRSHPNTISLNTNRPRMNATFQFTLNGKVQKIATDSRRTLLEVLREDLDLTGTKYGCGEG